MKVKLLKRLRRDWEIREYKDSVDGHIFRAFRKGKWIQDAIVPAEGDSINKLVMRIALYEFIRPSGIGPEEWFGFKIYERYFSKRSYHRDLAKSQREAANAKKIWHLRTNGETDNAA